MSINKKQIESVSALPSLKRYAHFIKVVADRDEVWGLYQDGWALAEDDFGQQVFPVWPAREYAELCAEREWDGYNPESFSLSRFMDELLPNLNADNVLVGVFYTPLDKGVTPEIEQLLRDLNEELDNY
ncbi:DUF2750 domain-containing protein [Aeromonas salmonicida]|uniref:DUF2750 domain-containing protein n=1 Tax=Aeromonas salmonicida TaxID=645 RepID=UPI00145A7696|nr:DUF2750 domain-containing protein [Aeromonas salmonicida]HDX8342536.1 DUF2750 domain-containing protein [Aeromonas dhakensis]